MSLREVMPETAAFIDALRAAFGAEAVNAAIRKGVGGLPGHFHAVENGHETGTPFPDGVSFTLDQLGLPPKRPRDAG